jgi:hypothetical protein
MERYIVAKSGATFEVHFRFSPPFPDDLAVSVVITVDGKDLDEPLIRQEELFDKEGHASMGPISNTGNSFRRQKYRFADLEIGGYSSLLKRTSYWNEVGEDVPGKEIIEAQKKQLADTGTISLHFYHIQTTCLNRTFEMAERNIQDPGTVHEKALKGGALSHALRYVHHRVESQYSQVWRSWLNYHYSLDKAEPSDEVEYLDAKYANNGEPFAVFHFYYRSLSKLFSSGDWGNTEWSNFSAEALKDLHIIKRTPEPIDLNDCDDEVIETSSLEQLRRMVIQLKRQEEIRQRLKRERSGSVTVVGDDEVVGDGNNSTAHEDIEVLGATDLRKERRKRRKNHKPTQEDEVIVID